tara:strand:- start:133 stop:1377 length:1245 start_codon:yes stop_codon:yes gene_type:complete
MMRRPLDRRMFVSPQQRRNMARMPQGILASGPRIMQAAMQQEPVRMSNGGFADTYLFGPNTPQFIRDLPGIIFPGLRDEGDTTTPNTGQNPAPSVDGSGLPDPNIDSDQAGDVNFSEIIPAPVGGAPYPQPGAINPTTGRLKTPDPRTEERRQAAEDAAKNAPKQGDGDAVSEYTQRLDQIFQQLGGKNGAKKTSDQYIDDAMDLLKKYGIEKPDLDARKKDRIVEFFLEMAAGDSPYALDNVTAAAKTAVKGFAQDRREVEKAEQDLALAGIQMGLADQTRAEASAQAVLLKKYDISGDLLKELSKDTKMNQIRGLMDLGVSEEDAIGYVFKGQKPSVYMERFNGFKSMGMSDGLANVLAAAPGTTLEALQDNPALAKQIANSILEGGGQLTAADKALLNLDADFGEQVRITR